MSRRPERSSFRPLTRRSSKYNLSTKVSTADSASGPLSGSSDVHRCRSGPSDILDPRARQIGVIPGHGPVHERDGNVAAAAGERHQRSELDQL